MSALASNFPKKPYTVSDDIESFVHVLIWMCAKWYRHSILRALLKDYVDHVFREYTVANGYLLGSTRKLLEGVNFIRDRVILQPQNDLPFRTLLNSVYTLLKDHYATFNTSELYVKYGVNTEQSPQIAQTADSDEQPMSPRDVERPLDTHDRLCQLFEEALGSEGQTDKLKTHQFFWEFPTKTDSKRSSQAPSPQALKRAKTSRTSDEVQ